MDVATDDEPLEFAATVDATEVAGAEYDVAKLLNGVQEPYRRVVQLFCLEERSCDEVADMLGMPVGTIKSLLFRARRLLVSLAQGEAA